MHQVTISAPAPVSPPISKPAGFPGVTSRPNDFSSALPLNLPSGFPGLPGLFPPVAMAAAAARQFVAQQQTAQPGLPSPVCSTAGFLSSPRNLTMGNNMGSNQTGNGNRAAPRASPTKIPRVGQGQVTCNCGIVFPSLEILERHAKEVHPENTNLVSNIFYFPNHLLAFVITFCLLLLCGLDSFQILHCSNNNRACYQLTSKGH